jgi:hypothetical protein
MLYVHVHSAYPCPSCIPMYSIWSMVVSMLHVYVYVHVAYLCACECCMYIYIVMPECWIVRHSVSPVPEWTELTMPVQVRYWTKLTQSGFFLVRYRTKILDTGMLMLALVFSMPMPSYDHHPRESGQISGKSLLNRRVQYRPCPYPSFLSIFCKW